MATLFFYEQPDLYSSIFSAISGYTRKLTFTIESLKNKNFTQTWNPDNRINLSAMMQLIWEKDLNIPVSILVFINKIQSEIKNETSFISFIHHSDTALFKILENYSINKLYQSNQFDMGWKKYIESGVLL